MGAVGLVQLGKPLRLVEQPLLDEEVHFFQNVVVGAREDTGISNISPSAGSPGRDLAAPSPSSGGPVQGDPGLTTGVAVTRYQP
jgi:hypothetical protein